MGVADDPERAEVGGTGGARLHTLLWRPRAAARPPSFLLVHGLASNALLWTGVAQRLAVRGHRVVAVDQRGHGRSPAGNDRFDFGTLTADLLAVADALELERPVAVGQSWGGNVVLELARRSPERLAGVALVDGGTIELSAVFDDVETCWAELAPPRLDGLRADELADRLRARHPRWSEVAIRWQLANFRERPDGTVTARLTRARHRAILEQLWAQRPSELYQDVAVPVLLLPVDDGDPTHTRRKSAEVAIAEARLPRVRVRWFRGDHDIHAEDPAGVAGALLEAVSDGWFDPSRTGRSSEPAV